MKILHVIHRFLPEGIVGGTTTYLYHLCREQMKFHNVKVFCSGRPRQRGPSFEDLNEENISIRKIYPRHQHWRWNSDNPEVNELFVQTLREFSPDIVHFHSLVLLSDQLPVLARQMGIPTLFTIHDQWFVCLKGFPFLEHGSHQGACYSRNALGCFNCLTQSEIKESGNTVRIMLRAPKIFSFAALSRPQNMQRLFQSIDSFIAPSYWIRDYYLSNGFDISNVHVSGYGIDTEPFQNLMKQPADKIRFGYLGGAHPAKGLSVLLEAFQPFGENAELHIYGHFKETQLKTWGSQPGVFFKGAVQGKEKMRSLSQLDIMVVPSLFPDNSPLVIHEARAARIPVIASKIGGIPELVEEEVTGFLFEPGNVKALREKLAWFVENPLQAERMRNQILPYKDIKQHLEEMNSFYENLTGVCHG